MADKNIELPKEGDLVDFPKNHNGMFTGIGKLIVINGEWCKVAWKDRGTLKTWIGRFSTVRKSYAAEKES